MAGDGFPRSARIAMCAGPSLGGAKAGADTDAGSGAGAVLRPGAPPDSHTTQALALTVTPVAFGPVLFRNNDGRVSRFPRALARFVDDDGSEGMGWIEWNQPDIVD